MRCASCGAENEAGRKFCGECGSALLHLCPSCGQPNAPTMKFCGECGSALISSEGTGVTASARAAPTDERRLVSVLFADLVGFTTLSEVRDAEEVRDLLSRYFETCTKLIGRYGGVVEKFIGDAVMAVWGSPVATEDDAERAVRAALDLVAAVEAFGAEVGAPDLKARAGVLTGEAAVTLGQESEGMVLGDMVNTASRIQSAAQPGSVLVGESTRRATDATIVFEDAGVHELKGKAEPLQLFRAVRVVAGAMGAQRSTGLEAPFVGRDRDLRLIKELFHASAEESKAALVSVTGIAGIGKTRLSWEFEKYVDGVAEDSLWHRGRCLSYGEGVAYWALVDMVKMRCRISEDEETVPAQAKLRSTLEEFVPDAKERAWIEPRLAHLLAIDTGPAGDQENVFSAWRTFFERMSERFPVVMVFEDMQWADAGLLDFVEYLLEWSRNHRIFILALARPEIHERRSGWGAGKRSFSSIYLEPLSPDAMTELLAGLVPGLPDELRDQILDRAQGVPLYAVETVRMLLDRGLLVQEGDVYSPTGPIEALAVPETLHALIAARLDGLTQDERRIVQDAAVLGKTFFKQGLSQVTGLTEDEVEPLLASLLRKEVLSLQADPRSPERGQYGFLQDLMRKVAYDTLSRKERKAKHLAAAAFIEEEWTGEEEEIVEVVAAHYLSAYEAAPEADDAEEIRTKAREHLVTAGDRASSLAAPLEAQRYFEKALTLTEEPGRRAGLLERAGIAARTAGNTDVAIDCFEQAIELFEGQADAHQAARVSARLGEAMWDTGRFGEAVDRMDRSFQVLSDEEPDEDLATLAAQLGRMGFFSGRTDEGMERIETAIDIAEGLWLPEVLSQALNTKAVILYSARGRRHEGLALLKYALEIAVENDMNLAALRAYYNLADLATQSDRYQEGRGYVDEGLALARRIGSRDWEWRFLSQTYPHFVSGEWDDVVAMAEEIPKEKVAEARLAGSAFLMFLPFVHANRGESELAEEGLSVFPSVDSSADVQEQQADATGRAAVHLAKGEPRESLAEARRSLAFVEAAGPGAEASKEAFVIGIEAAFELGELASVEEFVQMIEGIPRGKVSEYLLAHAMRTRARLAAERGDAGQAEAGLKGAAGWFREMAAPFHMAVAMLELAEWLEAQGRDAEAHPLLDESREIFERLGAKPWLDRLERADPRKEGAVTA